MNARAHIQEEIQQLLRTTEGERLINTGFDVNKAVVINVLVVGRAQVGKTTLVNALQDNAYSSELRGYSDTRDLKDHPIVMRDKENNRYYHINMIDTAGLDEHSRDPTQTRSNDQILNLTAKFIEKAITTLNAVIFVSKAGETHLNDLPALRSLMKFLGPSFRDRSMMVLTHCEGLTPGKFHELAQEIREHPQSRAIADYCQLGIHPHGTININKLETMIADDDRDLRIGTLKKDFRLVIPMRREILQLLVAQHDRKQSIGELQEIMTLANEARARFVEEEIGRRRRAEEAERRRGTPRIARSCLPS